MKKTLFALLGLMVLAMLAEGQSRSNGCFNYIINPDDTNTVTITQYTCTNPIVAIPTNIDGLTVTSLIGDPYDARNISVASVTIPNSVTTIGDYAFFNYASLTNVAIPNSIIAIGNAAFYGCSSLANVTIPDSVTSIGDGAFSICSSLTNIVIPDSVTNMGGDMFALCNGLTKIALPNSVSSVAAGEFYQCPNLSSVIIPEGVTEIADGAFLECTSLTNITIPNSMTDIGDEAFEDCTALTTVTIGADVTSIGAWAFNYCPNLTSIMIPESVTHIGDGAFSLSGLTSVIIPASVTTLGESAFGNSDVSYAYFEGDAPEGDDAEYPWFGGDPIKVIFYSCGAVGWPSPYSGVPSASCVNCTSGIPVGSLQVNITPVEAITAGAKWQVDCSPFQENGAVVTNLAVGPHTILFTPIPGLVAPSSQTVTITIGTTTVTVGDYIHTVFRTLHNFQPGGSDGMKPASGLILSGNHLYGTTAQGGLANHGTIFVLETNGSGYRVLHSFAASRANRNGVYTNSDGVSPKGSVILWGDTLYGTASSGGIYGSGTVFALNTNGMRFTNLYSFSALEITNSNGVQTNSEGASPAGNLIISNNTLYGTASSGGVNGSGTVFALSSNGTGFTNLHSFSLLGNATSDGVFTNNDGAAPKAGLVLSGDTLYGTASYGGNAGNGAVFAIHTNGTAFTNLPFGGGSPMGSLILSGNTLYGTAAGIKDSVGLNNGSVFAENINGTGFTNLQYFGGDNDNGVSTNTVGLAPSGQLILSGNMLYGTAYFGGTNGNGTVFAVSTNGSEFITLYNFAAALKGQPETIYNNSGAYPEAGLVLSGNTLYGTTSGGGNSTEGTVFSLSANDTVAVRASPSSGGTVRGGGTFAAGSSQTVVAKAKNGYTFVN